MNYNPAPQSGVGPYGSVPGVIGVPNPYQDLGNQIPNLSQINRAASNDILSNLDGTLSAGTENALKNASATYGAASGMPGSGLSWNSLYGNIAGASTGQQQTGMQEYDQFAPTVSGTQTVTPGLQTQIAGTNASNSAAPNPSMSASYSQQLFQQYLNSMNGPGGGGAFAGTPSNDPLTGIANWSPNDGSGYASE